MSSTTWITLVWEQTQLTLGMDTTQLGELRCSSIWEMLQAMSLWRSGEMGNSQHVYREAGSTRASLVAQIVKNLPVMQETSVWPLGWEDPLKEGMATHSSTLAWRSLWTEEPGGLRSMQLQSWCGRRQQSFWSCCYTKWPQGSSISSGPRFFLFFHSFCAFVVIFYWSRVDFWNCVCSDVQELDSVILRRLSLLSLGSCST